MNDLPDQTSKIQAPGLKTLTLRLPAELHERVQQAATDDRKSINQFFADAASLFLTGAAEQRQVRAAVYVDFDAFTAETPIDIEAIERSVATEALADARAEARIVQRKIISSLGTTNAVNRRALLARNYTHVETVSRDALRLHVVADALESVLASRVDVLLLVTADELFQTFPALLQRHDVRVYAIGVRPPKLTSAEFVRAFDTFRYYEQLAKPPGSAELQQLRAQYAEALVHAAYRLDARGAKGVGSALIPLLKDKYPEVSLQALELRNWRELAEVARQNGLLETIEPSGVDFLVRLSDEGRRRSEQTSAEATESQSETEGGQQIRRAVEEIFGTALPNTRERFAIYNATHWFLTQGERLNGVPLVDLSFQVADQLSQPGINQNTVYRVLFGLFRAGAFDFQENQVNAHDPTLVRPRVSVSHFDDVFVVNLMRVRNRFPVQARHDLLAAVLFDTPREAQKVSKLLRLAADPRGRAELLEAITANKQ